MAFCVSSTLGGASRGDARLLACSVSHQPVFLQIVTSASTDLQDYTYYFVPAPWLSVKLLRLLQCYPPPGNSRAAGLPGAASASQSFCLSSVEVLYWRWFLLCDPSVKGLHLGFPRAASRELTILL